MTYGIGIDLGGTKILIALVNKDTGEVVDFVKKKTKKDKGSERIIRKIIEGIKELLEGKEDLLGDISSIGIGAAGQVDRKNGILVSAPNLNCFNLNLKEELNKHFNIPIYLGNDVEVATMGEMKFGAAQGEDDFICVFVGTGVGSGIVKDGKIISGATGTAGEIGHMIVDLNGRICACGDHGCLEAYASRSAIERRIEGKIKKGRPSCITELFKENKKITSRMIQKSIEQDDELVTLCVTEAAEYLAGGLSSVINFVNPKVIILGGGLIEAVDYFYNHTVKKAKSRSLPVPAKEIEFKKATLGDFSGVIGAVFLEN